jgi:hypothetical protein
MTLPFGAVDIGADVVQFGSVEIGAELVASLAHATQFRRDWRRNVQVCNGCTSKETHRALFHVDDVCNWLLVLRTNTSMHFVFEQPYVFLTSKVCIFFF